MTADTAEERKATGCATGRRRSSSARASSGASAAYHLAELGSTDVLVIDQGPLFETGGSTSHAPGPGLPDERLAHDVPDRAGHRPPVRLARARRRAGLVRGRRHRGRDHAGAHGGAAAAAGVRPLVRHRRTRTLLTPDETAERIPLLDPNAILGAYLVPSDGIAKAVRIVTALAAKASARGVAFEGGVTVTGFDIRDGRVHGVETDRGRDRVRARADLRGDLGSDRRRAWPASRSRSWPCSTSWCGPIRSPSSSGETREVVHPILRHQDHAMYFRHREDHYGVGNYRHEPIVTPQRDIRRHGDGPMPSLMPFTPADFASAERETERLLPALAGHMRPADPARSINGMFSFTPDAGSIVGESANGPRPLALRGGVGHARWRDGTAGRRVDGERRARLRPGRGGREPLLPVPDHAAVRAGAGRAAVPRGLRHPASAAADDRAAEAPADAVLRAPRGARRGVLHRRGLGTSAVVRGEPRAADRRRLGAARRVGRHELVARRRRRARGHPRARGAVRHHAVREVRRGGAGCARATWSGSAPTGSTGPSARSSTRRCSRRRAGSDAT